MLTKIYAGLWIAVSAVALLLALTGNMTMLVSVVFGFIAFGLIFMGMMGVLPATVVHAHHTPAKAAPIGDSAQNIRGRIRDYKETVSKEAFAVRRPRFP